jgi:uncharacterized membrane protein required for colicin V production
MTNLDLLFGIALLISGLLSIARGLIREILLFCCVAIAIGVGVATAHFVNSIAAVLASLVTFPICLFGAAYIAHRTLDKGISLTDRALGLLFGLVRGLFPVTLGLVYFELLASQGSRPLWIQNAFSYPLLEHVGQSLLATLTTIISLIEVESSDRSALVVSLLIPPLLQLTFLSFFVDFLAVVTRRWRLYRFENGI